MRRSPIMIRVTSGDEILGHITPAELRAASGAPRGVFLPEVIARFNSHKEAIGEPERVSQVFARDAR